MKFFLNLSQLNLQSVLPTPIACHVSKYKWVNLNTDGRYAFGVIHNLDVIRKLWEFLTFSGTPIKNGLQEDKLIFAILLP